jgi:hypothetical protein
MSKIVHLPKGGGGGTIVDVAEPTTLGQRSGPTTGTRASALSPELGWARLEADDDPKMSLLCELGDAFPAITQGYGGWDEVDRPHNVSLTTWRGFKPTGIDLPLMLDQWALGTSVETAVDVLEALAGRGRLRTNAAAGGYAQPPLLIVHTAGVMPYDAHGFPDERWVITNLDWNEDDTITNDAGNRVRAPVTVSLLQYVADTRLADQALALRELLQSRRAKRGTARRTYTVRQGETLVSIARTQLGDPGRWVEIVKLNHLRDPRAVKPGARIRIPWK